jgi:predicted nucleic acid-binding protein
MNGTTRISFDTCAIVKLVDRQYDLASLGIDVDKAEQFASVIARMESLAKPVLLPDEERDIRAFLEGIEIVTITPQIEAEAILIRRKRRLKLPDCIIAATAVITNSTLLTDDDDLLTFSWPGYTVQSLFAMESRPAGGGDASA